MERSKEDQATTISRRGFLRAATVSTAATMAAVSPRTAFGLAEDTASNGAAKSWKTPPDPIPDAKIAKTAEADVVIIGAGAAGAAAARSAAEAGASVIVIEKQSEDKYTCIGNELGVVNSKFALDAGAPRIDPHEFFAEWQRRMGNRTNPRLVKQYVFESGAACDWLFEVIPAEVRNTATVFGLPLPRHYAGSINGIKSWVGTVMFYGKGLSWTDAMKHTGAKARTHGAQFLFGTSAEYLFKNGNRVAGVVAKDEKGNYIKVTGKKGLLLSCGDFSRNKELVADLLSEHLSMIEGIDKFRGMGREGDGHKMGVWAGGRIERGPRAMQNTIDMVALAGALGKTAFLRMNREGKRYTNEASWASIAQGFRQPKGTLCAVWDSNWREELDYQPMDHGNITMLPKILDRLEKEFNALAGTGANGGMVHGTVGGDVGMPSKHYCANTLGELADYLGYKDQAKKNFLATVERYNELVKKGVDEDFGKDPSLLHPIVKPPFFASISSSGDTPTGAMVTLVGLEVDENQKVLDNNDDPIPGLFASGNCCGGRYSTDYITPVCGNSIGWAFTMGRIAGKYIAESSSS